MPIHAPIWSTAIARARLSNDAPWSRLDLEWLIERSISWRVRLPLDGECAPEDGIEAVLSVCVASRLGEPCVACAHLREWPSEADIDDLIHTLIVWARRALAEHHPASVQRRTRRTPSPDQEVNALEALWAETTTGTTRAPRELEKTRTTSPALRPPERATRAATTSPTAPTRPALPRHDD